MARRYEELLAQARSRVRELMPWDLAAELAAAEPPLVLDVREPAEYAAAHIAGALHVPRGVLEQACEWDHDETEAALVGHSARAIVVVCRSGRRSLLAGRTLQELGYTDVTSLASGLRGWNDADQPLVDGAGRPVDGDAAQALFAPHLRPEQRRPRR